MRFQFSFPELGSRLLFVCFLLANTSVMATSWRVNNTLSAPDQVDFNQLTEAVNSNRVQPGDTIYVEGSTTNYDGRIEILKRLTIIGPGYFLNQPNLQPTACNQLPATISGGNIRAISLLEGSDGTTITGMSVSNPANTAISIFNTSNITISRNRIDRIIFEGDEVASNILITRNIICRGILFGCANVNAVTITNNLIASSILSNCPTTINNGLIINNTLPNDSRILVSGSTIAFNYVGYIDPDPNNISINNNILSINNSDNQTIVAQNGTNEINSYMDDSFSCNSDNWTLIPVDQTTTHGAYNGPNPYYSSNPISPAVLPAIPIIYDCEVQSCGDQSIEVSFQVRANQ